MARDQTRRRAGGVFARVPRPEWLAWLEEQEQKPPVLLPPNNPVVEEFDPLLPQARIVEEDLGEWERWGTQGKGRNRELLKRWFFTRDLEDSIVSRMLDKIRQSVRTRHKLRLRWGILLRNVGDDRPLFFYTNVPPSPWMNKLTESKAWLEAMEETRLQGNVQRPDTSWVFVRAVSVELKAILDRQPLRIGRGRLPDWLRNKREVISLDTYEDSLCLFRCLAVHQGALPARCVRLTTQLARSFISAHLGLRPPPPVNMGNRVVQPPIGVDKLYWVEKHFQQGIAAFTVTPAGDFVLTHTPAHYDQIGRPTMTIGIYEEHAFLIKDINKVTNNYTCGDCDARFVKSCNLLATYSSSTAPAIGSSRQSRPSKRLFTPTAVSVSRLFVGWSTRQSSGASTFTTKDVVTGVSESFTGARLMVITQRAKPSSSTMGAIGTGVSIVFQRTQRGPTYSQKPAMGVKSRERTPTKKRCSKPTSSGATATQFLKDGSTSFPAPGGMTGARRRETKRTHTLLFMTSRRTRTRPRQASQRGIFLTKASTCPILSPSRTR